ncbi:response regulator transcription factor [Shewanella gelidii]|uniref:DNA-binding response regulator n=1 Tax=Shewanella gelidii TaxID=1642821 RepID=A0A917JVU8_9GAMM|nr:response regulator transcription factor [Shewanella gelidii]MCL1098889.1 response regulator transcription factor [Shewanella gelidii]GGI89736.1 DNA-binding response regulator [Shewanella gelidii]
MKVLLVEDDPKTIDYIASGFSAKGHDIDSVANGVDGLLKAQTGNYDLLVLDRMLPGLDGLGVLAELRGGGDEVPVMILSALSHVDERVKGLRAGGDDYMTKPFAFAELLLRCEKLLSRYQQNPAATELIVGALQIDLITRNVTLGGEKLLLQPKEFKLLRFLMEHAGQVISRTMLFEAVWDYHFDPRTNVIEVHIAKLRRKFAELGYPDLIETVRGAGYLLREKN